MNETGEFYDPLAGAYDPPAIATDEEEIADDVRFYRNLAGEVDGPTLEVGVGTGRIYLELLADGVDIDGIDVSPAMIDQLREYAASCDLAVQRGDGCSRRRNHRRLGDSEHDHPRFPRRGQRERLDG